MSIKSFQVFNGFAKTGSVSGYEMAGSSAFRNIHAKNQLEFGFFEGSFWESAGGGCRLRFALSGRSHSIPGSLPLRGGGMNPQGSRFDL